MKRPSLTRSSSSQVNSFDPIPPHGRHFKERGHVLAMCPVMHGLPPGHRAAYRRQTAVDAGAGQRHPLRPRASSRIRLGPKRSRAPEVLALSPLDARIGQRSRRREDDFDPGPDLRPGPAQSYTASRARRRFRPFGSIADRAINSTAAISACRAWPARPSPCCPARSAGDYMLPIIYENQCQACHPLYKTPGVVHHRQTPQRSAGVAAGIRAGVPRRQPGVARANSSRRNPCPMPGRPGRDSGSKDP